MSLSKPIELESYGIKFEFYLNHSHIQHVSLLKFMQYAAENGNGAEGWSMQVLNAITSRFEEMQLIYVIKT